MTGTGVNPLLRAAHLAKAGYNTTLHLPWLVNVADQVCIYGYSHYIWKRGRPGKSQERRLASSK